MRVLQRYGNYAIDPWPAVKEGLTRAVLLLTSILFGITKVTCRRRNPPRGCPAKPRSQPTALVEPSHDVLHRVAKKDFVRCARDEADMRGRDDVGQRAKRMIGR